MLTYLLIGAIVMVAIAPLLHFVPSKRQKQISDMREAVALSGLYVEFRDLPGERLGASYRSGELIYYGKRLPPGIGEGLKAHHWIKETNGEWRGPDWRNPMPDSMASLPEAVIAIGVDEGSCGVYWQESSSMEDVDKICAAIHVWAEELSR